MNGNEVMTAGYAGMRTDRASIEPARQYEVPREFESIDRTAKGILQGLEHLESRLGESVLRQEAGKNAVGYGDAQPPRAVPSTALGGRLQEMNSLLATANERIQSLIARLEA